MSETYPHLESKHYIFYFEPGSLAEQEIELIAQEQEQCYDKICSTLGISYPDKIAYYLLDSAERVGALFGDWGPINAFAALGENKIFAVYNTDVKCTGCHEDTHLISSLLNVPQSEFLMEGLAMYFDETWWGLKNETWARYYKMTSGADLSVKTMLENKDFYAYDCMISYPVAGAFVKHLIDRYGMDRFLALYQYKGSDYAAALASIYQLSLAEIEKDFWQALEAVEIDLAKINAALSEA